MSKKKEEEKTYYGRTLPEVVITGDDPMKRRLLEIPGEYYFYNPGHWVKAMRYMQRLGDTKAEQRIFNKSFNYGRERDAKRVLLLFGGIFGALYAPPLLGQVAADTGYWLTYANAGKSIIGAYGSSTYWRMGINASTQTLLAGGDFREIDCFSVGAEMMPPWANALSPMMEIRPSGEVPFRCTFYNKSVSETAFDITVNQLIGKIDSSISSVVKKNIGKEMTNKLINDMIQGAATTYRFGFQFGTGIITEGTKKALNLDPKNEIQSTKQ